MSKRILCVDDEQNVLDAYRRGLRKLFQIETALGGAQALEMLDSENPFAVIVSDMRMPGMDGAQFLAAASRKAPDTVRMMLTGNADQQTAVNAVNEGKIFRFLNKPCPPEVLADALNAGIEQYRLVTAEKELLEQTLRGSIEVLNDVLSLASPAAFGNATRVRKLVSGICEKMGVENGWECEIAAMLSQIGCITIPPDTLQRHYQGEKLLRSEIEMIQSHPSVGRELVSHIPRLGSVADSIAYQNKCFDGSGLPDDDLMGAAIPLGARILKVALDYDAAQWGGGDEFDAMSQLRDHAKRYDPDALAALREVVGIRESLERQEIALRELAPGMSLAEAVKTGDGMVVVAKGQEVTPALYQRIRNFSRHRKIVEPICVFVCVAVAATC